MRLALVVALARDIHARNVTVEDFRWAYQYVSFYDMAMVRAVIEESTENEHQANVKKVLDLLNRSKTLARTERNKNWVKVLKFGAMPHSMLLKYMHMEKRRLDAVIETMVESGLIAKHEAGISINTYGFAGVVYCLDSSGDV